ncbi:MAG: carboxylating nicotinate-nucleotide diphosphorylase [Proteobacteria bacterium]|nr:carboxylating nicotinate-nucleotide diphosphorylase [Pseudomonadota bacterium]
MRQPPTDSELEPLVRAALAEDWGKGGDITTDSIISPASRHEACLAARQKGVVCGLACARLAFQITDASLVFMAKKKDGDIVTPGEVMARISGATASILKGERVALNFMTHLSGIATLTRRFVDEVKGTKATISCTRKTLPGLRHLQKYAVRMGGGKNHRFTLDEVVLIKDNHLIEAGSIAEAVKRARAHKGYTGKVEVEVDALSQIDEALKAGADIIMLDNFSSEDVRKAVSLIQGRAVIEVSGGVSLANVRGFAEAGADIISIGALTHSAPALDLGLDF